MTGGATTFKLGILALLSLVALGATAFVLGVHGNRAPTITYHAYFDESVQGLEGGSPVKFRGVRIGNVSAITIAPDGRRVDVSLAIVEPTAERLQLDRPGLRAQLGTQGITGVKYVDLDFFGGVPAPLPFPPAARYIPSQPSLFKGLESGVDMLLDRAPRVLDRTLTALERFNAILADVDDAAIPARIAASIDGVAATAQQVRAFVSRVDRANVPATAARLLARADATLEKFDTALALLAGERGVLVSAQRAVDDIGALGRRAAGSTDELDRALNDISEAAQALRELLEEIERDPDMLVKGRGGSRRP